MKALQVMAPGESQIVDVPDPVPAPGQLIMRVEAVTTCPQWDLHLRHNEPMFVGHQFQFPYTPGRPGHEASGTVAAVGANVTEFEVGDRIATWHDYSENIPGCYAQYMALPAEGVLKIPAHLSAVETAPLELAMCVGAVFLRLKKMHLLQGARYGVMGLGPAGLIAAQMLRAEGAGHVIGFDLSPQRRESAAALTDEVADPTEWKTSQKLDGIVDCVGAKASVEWAMDHASDFVALFGVQRQDYTFAVRHYLNLCLIGYPGHSRPAAEYALELITRGALDLKVLSTHHLPLNQYHQGIDLLERQQAIKVCFHPWE